MGEVIAARSMNTLYIMIDIVFLCFFTFVLIYTKRFQALVAGLLGGILYFIVDYGIFYHLLHTRTVSGADPALFLLWLSISYGMTNFAWIWLWLDRDGHAFEWSLLIMSGWFCTAIISQCFGKNFAGVEISRGTDSYHAVMAVFLFVGYAGLILWNLKRPAEKADIKWIFVIGVLVQGAWEFILAITGIRNLSLQTFLVNSLLETNMGLPYLWAIHKFFQKPRRSGRLKGERYA